MASRPAPEFPPRPPDDGDKAYHQPFHHPSWPEPWSHPVYGDASTIANITGRQWRTEPWHGVEDRSAARFIDSGGFECEWPWGWVVYRTVYTPESCADGVWESAMQKLDMIVRYAVHSAGEAQCDVQEPWDWKTSAKASLEVLEPDERYDDTPERIVCATYKNVIIEDKARWDGASVDDIREDFKSYLIQTTGELTQGPISPRFTACLVIDEESLKSLVDAADDGEPPRGWVTVVDPFYDADDSYCDMTYRGWMRVDVGNLWEMALELKYFGIWEVRWELDMLYVRDDLSRGRRRREEGTGRGLI